MLEERHQLEIYRIDQEYENYNIEEGIGIL